MPDLTAVSEELLDYAIKAGADAVSASAAATDGIEASVRDGAVEDIGRSETLDIGLRVIVGNKQACVSASNASSVALQEMAIRSVAMASESPEDPYCGLAEPDEILKTIPNLDLCDATEANAELLKKSALTIDEAAHGVEGVNKSEGSTASWRRSEIALVMSNGFSASRNGSFWSVSCSAIAGDGLGMERDYAYSVARWQEDLRALEAIGEEAGIRAVRRLNPRKAPTKDVPLVFDQRLAASVLGHFLSAINGSSVTRGSTYLTDFLGKKIFPDTITITDDPLIVRGLASRPFDGEGLPTAKAILVDKGVLQTWMMDCSTARQLGMKSTGSASFGVGSTPHPSPSNVTLSAGQRTPKDMISDIKEGFFVTEMMGASINSTTGDYSRGASGFWIENGEIAYPVTEATVAGNLISMFANVEAANDLPDDRAVRSPTLLIEGCSVAGV